MRSRWVVAPFRALLVLLLATNAWAQDAQWREVLAKARGQTVYWNAWAGDDRTNAFIAWAGAETLRRFGVRVVHVKIERHR